MRCKSRLPLGAIAGASLLLCAVAGTKSPAEERISGCELIRNASQLQAMSADPTGVYCLANDIDAGSIANFVPIDDFVGRFSGNNYVIRNLDITRSAARIGLFGTIRGSAIVQDVMLENVSITGTGSSARVGALVGEATDSATIARAYVTGRVSCTGAACVTGGVVGELDDSALLTESWSSAEIEGRNSTGGAVGLVGATAAVTRSYATGGVTCSGSGTAAGCGGVAGLNLGSVSDSYSTGAVRGSGDRPVGGVIGRDLGKLTRAHASGPVRGGPGSTVGGLVGRQEDGMVTESYAVGAVSGQAGSTLGGVIGTIMGTPTVTSVYWDTFTTGQLTSAGGLGTGRTTTQLRAALPAGFSKKWGISAGLSYPFLDDFGIDFAAPLATLVLNNKILAFLPISQLDESQYATRPDHENDASLATVYTMIARAIGITKSVGTLKGVEVDRYFWKDSARKAVWQGPVRSHATLGAFKPIAASLQLSEGNVIGQLRVGRLVILRGSYTGNGGGKATHWMLATLLTQGTGGSVNAVLAHDPWTGMQVMIDPVSKKVVAPSNFPLRNFVVNGYRPVTLN